MVQGASESQHYMLKACQCLDDDKDTISEPCQGNVHVLSNMNGWQVTPVGHSVRARHGSGQWLCPGAELALLLCASRGVSRLPDAS